MSSSLLWSVTPPPPIYTAPLDPSQGIQRIIDSFAGLPGVVTVGLGTYYGDPSNPTAPILNPGNVKIQGVGPDGSLIGSPVLQSGPNCAYEGIWIRAYPGAAYGLKIYNGGSPFIARTEFDRVKIGAVDQNTAIAGNAPRDGLVLDGAGVIHARLLTIAFNLRHGLVADSTGVEPNTTLKCDMCSFVQNGYGPAEVTGFGINLQGSMSIAEFNGGNSEGNKYAEFNAASMNSVRLRDMDFETSSAMAAQCLFGGCNPVIVDNCNFRTDVGKATRALSFATCQGVKILPNRYDGWTSVGIVRLDENCDGCWVDPMQVNTGSCWVEDYSR